MNKVIVAGDTLSAAVKIVAAVGVVYGGYKVYQFSKSLKASADELQNDIESATLSGKEFFTETINPASEKNAINGAIGDYTRPVFFSIFDFLVWENEVRA